MKREIVVFVKHILESIVAINSFLGNLSKSELEKDRIRQSAIIRELEVIGEAVKNIPKNVREEYSNIAWKQIAGMRDKLIHHYFGVDLDIVWDTIKKDLPELERQIKEILKEESSHPR